MCGLCVVFEKLMIDLLFELFCDDVKEICFEVEYIDDLLKVFEFKGFKKFV